MASTTAEAADTTTAGGITETTDFPGRGNFPRPEICEKIFAPGVAFFLPFASYRVESSKEGSKA